MIDADGTDDGLGDDVHRGRPRKASRREVGYRLNRIVLGINALHAEVSELRHELGIIERIEPCRRKVSPETGR